MTTSAIILGANASTGFTRYAVHATAEAMELAEHPTAWLLDDHYLPEGVDFEEEMTKRIALAVGLTSCAIHDTKEGIDFALTNYADDSRTPRNLAAATAELWHLERALSDLLAAATGAGSRDGILQRALESLLAAKGETEITVWIERFRGNVPS